MREAIELIHEIDFGLVLVDLGLPDGSGVQVLREGQRVLPRAISIILTVMDGDEEMMEAFSAGAKGYVLKEESGEDLGRLLRRVEAGESILSPSVARRLIEHFRETGPMRVESSGLTKREREVLALVGRGLRNREVGDALGISAHTVASHVKVIYEKLGICSRAEASWHATRFGL